MKRRNILVICMFDSVHAARWLSQFTDMDINFHLIPSKKFKYIHQDLLRLTRNKNGAAYKISNFMAPFRFLGFLDFFVFEFLGNLFKVNIRAFQLWLLLRIKSFEILHALEIQGAGYLMVSLAKKNYKKTKIILTNWGSDIQYFRNEPFHLEKIKKALNLAEYYSAECNRDYDLAIKLGFQGKFLPCIPNGGGFKLSEIEKYSNITSERKKIIVKLYGGKFGRGLFALEAIERFLNANQEYRVFFYSVTDDLIDRVKKLKLSFPKLIEFATAREPIDRKQLLEIMGNSRVYIGSSVSDGISTSFLEAIICGAYPIQTETSCAGEWVIKGGAASIVAVETESIFSSLQIAISDDNLVRNAQLKNRKLAIESLQFDAIAGIAKKFYEI